jgi:hypothetical protein
VGEPIASLRFEAKRALPLGATSLPLEMQHALVDFWTNQLVFVQRTDDGVERETAVHRENIARAAVFLLRDTIARDGESDGEMRSRLERTSRAATAALQALGIRDGFGLADARGRTDDKCLLKDVAEQAVALYLPHRTRVKRRRNAYLTGDVASGACDDPKNNEPAADRIALTIYVFALGDAACIRRFGLVPDRAIEQMRGAILNYLETNRGSQWLKVDELCGHALVAAGLLTPKERSGFFVVDCERWRRERRLQ